MARAAFLGGRLSTPVREKKRVSRRGGLKEARKEAINRNLV